LAASAAAARASWDESVEAALAASAVGGAVASSPPLRCTIHATTAAAPMPPIATPASRLRPEGGAGLRRGASAARRRWSSYFLMAASANNFGARRGHGFMDEAINQSCADQTSQRSFVVAVPARDDHKIGNWRLICPTNTAAASCSACGVEYHDADLTGDQEVADFIGGQDMP